MDAGDCQGEVATLLAVAAGDVAALRELIAALPREEAERLLLAAVMRLGSVAVTSDLRLAP